MGFFFIVDLPKTCVLWSLFLSYFYRSSFNIPTFDCLTVMLLSTFSQVECMQIMSKMLVKAKTVFEDRS